MRKVISSATRAIVTYSQNKEDIVLTSLFKDVAEGVYVDVGAAHPDYLSVTKAFYQRGWHGVNIEPNERLAQLITKVRPRDTTYQMAVARKDANVPFREYLGDGLSTTSPDIKERYTSVDEPTHRYYRDYDVPAAPLATILKKSGVKEIHFMKIDVEGAESQVIKSNDWAEFRPHILCIDAVHGGNDWQANLDDNGYKRIFHDGLNDYYADARYYQELPIIDYNFIYGTQILSSEWIEKMDALRKENVRATDDIHALRRELATRPTAEGEGLRFRAIAKVVLKKVDAYVTGKILPKPNEDLPGGNSFDSADRQNYDRAIWSAMTDSRSVGLSRRATLKGYRVSKRIVKKAAKVAKGVKK